jgi:hypothetical protein
MLIERDKVQKRHRLALLASLQAMLLAIVTAGASSALAQDDAAAAKRKNEFGLGATGQSSGQGLRRPEAALPDQKKEKRGNTPPGSDRAGDQPASGAIVDPAGVTK